MIVGIEKGTFTILITSRPRIMFRFFGSHFMLLCTNITNVNIYFEVRKKYKVTREKCWKYFGTYQNLDVAIIAETL